MNLKQRPAVDLRVTRLGIRDEPSTASRRGPEGEGFGDLVMNPKQRPAVDLRVRVWGFSYEP